MWDENNLFQRETAHTSFWVTRNANLTNSPHLETNPVLVYQTPEVQFKSPVMPSLIVESYGPFPAETTLYKTLESGLLKILSLGTSVTPTRQIKLRTAYSFAVSKDSQGSSSRILRTNGPVLLADGVTLKNEHCRVFDSTGLTVTEFLQKLSEDIESWYQATLPLTDAGLLVMKLTLFAAVNGTNLPLLTINEIGFSVPDEWWHDS